VKKKSNSPKKSRNRSKSPNKTAAGKVQKKKVDHQMIEGIIALYKVTPMGGM
jgi:hypothetical protein